MSSGNVLLFKTQCRCALHFLTNGEKVSVVTGFGKNIFIGTNHGHLYICQLSDNANWKIHAKLDLPKSPIDQLICASALNILLLVSENALSYVDVDDFSVASAATNVKYLALNEHPTTEDPFALQLAIGTFQKQIVVAERLIDGKISVEEKISVDSNVICLCYSRNAICYATEHAYHVHNLLNKVSHRLFDFDSGLLPPLISNIGTEEFVMYGIGGLAIFVNSDGISSRAPLALGSSEVVRAIEHKDPFLLSLTESTLNIFSLLSQKLEQSLSCSSTCRFLVNMDGSKFLIAEDGAFEIVPVSLIAQVEERLDNCELNEAIELMQNSFLQFLSDDTSLLKLKHLKQRAALLCLAQKRVKDCFDLLIEAEADPREILMFSREIAPDDFAPSADLRDGLDLSVIPPISLEIIEQYLQRIRSSDWLSCYAQTVDSTLAKIFILKGDVEGLEELDCGLWNDFNFRSKWLLPREHFNVAAKLAMDDGCLEEAFEIWRRLAVGEIQDQDFVLDECFERAKSLDDRNIMLTALGWMAQLKPGEAMEVVESSHILNANDAGRVLEIFGSCPKLLLSYLEKRINVLDDVHCHRKLFQLYVDAILLNDKDPSLRANCRRFLLFSKYLDSELIAEGEWKDKSRFAVEAILIECNGRNDVECLKKLIDENSSTFDLSAAELLCSKFSNSRMLKLMLNLYLRLSRSDPVMRQHIPNILNLLESDTEVVEVLANIPQDLACSDLISSFLSRSLAHVLSDISSVKLKAALGKKASADGREALRLQSSTTSHRVEEEAKCYLCGLPVGREGFVRYANTSQLVHLRCHSSKTS